MSDDKTYTRREVDRMRLEFTTRSAQIQADSRHEIALLAAANDELLTKLRWANEDIMSLEEKLDKLAKGKEKDDA